MQNVNDDVKKLELCSASGSSVIERSYLSRDVNKEIMYALIGHDAHKWNPILLYDIMKKLIRFKNIDYLLISISGIETNLLRLNYI
jgi:hypothetical protein